MKNLILILAAVLCSQAAFAQEDNYEQAGFPAPKAPAGDMHLDDLKEIKLSENLVLVTYLDDSELRGRGQLTAYDSSADVNCTLDADQVAMSNFKEVKRESVGGSRGARFYVNPKDSITLRRTMSSGGVEEVGPSCPKGHPELCEGQATTYAYRTTITLTDKASNEWSLSCLAPFSRELLASDVKINGIRIK